MTKVEEILKDLREINNEIKEEIEARPQYANVGKKGCWNRISNLIAKYETSAGLIRQEVDLEKLNAVGIDLVNEFFPKGKCQERGEAIVLYSKFVLACQRAIDSGEVFKK